MLSSLKSLLDFRSRQIGPGRPETRRPAPDRRSGASLRMETLEKRALMAAAIMDGAWSDPATWEGGVVPDASERAIISQGITVQLDKTDHVAKELVIHGNLVVPEGDGVNPAVNKTLTTRWVHINSGGVFRVGSAAERYDNGSFTLTLTGTDVQSDHVIERVPNMMNPSPTMTVMNNDGFLMTGMGGRIQIYGEDKLSFTKLAATVAANEDEITIENVIERNFNTGAMTGNEFVTSAADDGAVNWEVGDQIVIASSSYDYTEEDVRTIAAISDNGDGTSTLTLDSPLSYRHYGETETYGEAANAATDTTPASQTYSIDMRAEVALLSRNVKIQGLASQDTDARFGDRANMLTEARVRSGSLGPHESVPSEQVANGVGGHIMIMPNSGPIIVDGVQLERMGQSSQKGRYPIHWHLGDDRSGDVMRNSSITNSNNRGVTIHGTSNLQIEGVVLHDVHGHGFFFEDAVETGNVLVGNLALGLHTVGGNDADFASPGTKDPFVVDTHDSFLETGSRFSGSSGFWITNPTNTLVGNIVAGMGDQRTDSWANPQDGNAAGTGFWYAIPRTALGESGAKAMYANVQPIFAEFGQFDYNTSHTTAVGLNFDRGSDIEDAHLQFDTVDFGAIQPGNQYAPRVGQVRSGDNIPTTLFGFTNYKSTDAAFYHRGEKETINLDGLRVADSFNGPWAVSENKYSNSLFVGHSAGNGDLSMEVGGPRLYDGSGLYTNTHFAGFGGENAYAFQVEGSSFGPTMYHAFHGTSFENDGTHGNITHAVSDFTPNGSGHNLGQPSQWIKGAMDLDGTLTGTVGSSIVPDVAFLVDEVDFVGQSGVTQPADTQPAGWDAWLTDDIYARMRIQNKDDGEALFPPGSTGEPLVRFTARDGDSIDVMGGQQINNQFYWTQIAAKAESDGFVDGTLTVEFLRQGLPKNGFVLNMDNQDGDRPHLVPAIQAKVDAARLVSKFVGAGNYTPNIGVEVFTEGELRDTDNGTAYFRDATGNLYLNTSIGNQPLIEIEPGAASQTEFASHKVEYGTTIQAESFDIGADGFAYHDTDSVNTFGTDRAGTGVDVGPTSVGDLDDGEWLEYTTEIVAAGYNIGVNISSTAAGGQIRVSVAESNSAGFLRTLGTVNVPDTGGVVSTQWLDPIDLSDFAGVDSVIRVEFIGEFDSSVEFASLQFARPTQTAYTRHAITANLSTSTIELEAYDVGGQGIAYSDTSAGNPATSDNLFKASNESSDTFRTEERVDANDLSVTGEVREGEWLEYTTDIQSGIYDITLKKIWGNENNGAKLFIANQNSALDFDLLGEFDFQTGENHELITLRDINLTPWAGTDRVIRIEIVGNYMGLDSLTFANTASGQSPFVSRAITTAATTRIELEEYDLGGQDIAYSDNTPTNDAGTIHRPGEGVDSNGNLVTNNIENGEWLEYTTDIEAGFYDITLGKAWSAGADGVRLLIGESNSATEFTDLGLFSFPAGGGEAITLENIDLTTWGGTDRVIRLQMEGSYFGIDYLDFAEHVEATDQVAPRVESVVVNGGNDQRSMVSEVTVTFNEEVTGVDASAFVLTNTTTNAQVVPLVSTRLINGQTVATLTFGGPGITGGSLADGNYTLTTLAGSVSDLAGNQLDGNRDGSSGDDATDDFFRLYGDIDGDRDVDRRDLLFFGRSYVNSWFNRSFDSAFDFDGDGDVDRDDLAAFFQNFNSRLLP